MFTPVLFAVTIITRLIRIHFGSLSFHAAGNCWDVSGAYSKTELVDSINYLGLQSRVLTHTFNLISSTSRSSNQSKEQAVEVENTGRFRLRPFLSSRTLVGEASFSRFRLFIHSALNLQQASGLLAELGQVASASVKNTIKPFVEAVGQQSIVRHKDKDVKLLAASCISEVLRLCAPDAPYEDPTLKVGLQFQHKYT